MNPQQADAIRHTDGPLLILAGAGSGKTRVITHRIAHLICECGVAPWSIVAVTFTNKAAGEMRERVNKLIEGRILGDGPTVSTFHSYCVRLLRRYGDRLADIRTGFTRNFTIYDDDDQVSIVKAIYRGMGVDPKSLAPRTALSMISSAKSAKDTPDDVKAKARDPIATKVAEVYSQYETRLRNSNALDFDDLLLESVRLLQHDKSLREALSDRIRYLLIDEYQDTNRSQYELMQMLSFKHRNLCVVGDEDQSIYSWRGADIRNILDFERDFPNAKVVRLEQNYRSTKSILDAASAVVSNNKERKGKKLWTAGAAGEQVAIYEAIDEQNEALFIADTIEKVMRDNARERVAILYRTNSQSRPIEEALRRYGRAYKVVGGFSFYQRAEVKDVLAYLRVLQTPTDNVSLLRIINTPARGIGKSSIDVLEQVAAEQNVSLWDGIGRLLETHQLGARAETALTLFRTLIQELQQERGQPLARVMDKILDRTGYLKMLESDTTTDGDSRVANVQELLKAAQEAAERGEGIAEFLDHAALISDADSVDEAAQISMLTIHNAKGLEFPVVFLAGMEEGLFPHSRAIQSGGAGAIEEERRLCYVGMTRAEKHLYLTLARARRRFGGGSPEPSIPSRFLNELPPQCTRKLRSGVGVPEVNLFSEQYEVRHTVRKNLYTGKTYNSVENVQQFFKDRGGQATNFRPSAQAAPVARPAAAPVKQAPLSKPAPKRSKLSPGSTITHPNYGRGTIVRKEGEGPEAKITVNFPGYGLKKLIAKYAGLTDE
ncbi:MAG: UvrD-helicase domain-containing protein [Bryobacteraceae bacterium]|nr:UvrD-helicase domain-containing protein [Bryobacteraceae bacterium]